MAGRGACPSCAMLAVPCDAAVRCSLWARLLVSNGRAASSSGSSLRGSDGGGDLGSGGGGAGGAGSPLLVRGGGGELRGQGALAGVLSSARHLKWCSNSGGGALGGRAMALSATSRLALVAMRISSASRANAKLAIVAMRSSSSSMNPSSERMKGGSGISH